MPSRLIRHPYAQALRGLAGVPIRVAAFAVRSWADRNGVIRPSELPPFALSGSVLAQVALDEAILGVMKTPARHPTAEDTQRIGDELAAAAALYHERGWADNPRAYHADPPAPSDIRRRRASAMGLAHERLSWVSGFTPDPDEPLAARWTARTKNEIAYAHVFMHEGGPRPWVVAIHGLGTGQATADIVGMRVKELHLRLGYNVVLPVLPRHGRRAESFVDGQSFLSYELAETVLGMAHAMWDVRSLIRLLRTRYDATSISLYGVSLGAYCSSLLSVLEPGLERVVVGVPLVDVPGLFQDHATPGLRELDGVSRLIGEDARVTHSVISPLAVPPLLPRERLAVFAGLGDRLTPADQALRLWEHWARPDLCLYPGNHVGFLWSSEVAAFVRSQFADGAPLDQAAEPPASATTVQDAQAAASAESS